MITIEVDGFDHCDKDNDYKKETEEELKESFGCKFNRIIPDEEDFNVIKAINEILRHTKKSI